MGVRWYLLGVFVGAAVAEQCLGLGRLLADILRYQVVGWPTRCMLLKVVSELMSSRVPFENKHHAVVDRLQDTAAWQPLKPQANQCLPRDIEILV